MATLDQMLSIKDAMRNTPLIPGYYFGKSSRRRRKSSRGRYARYQKNTKTVSRGSGSIDSKKMKSHLKRMAKKLKVTLSKNSKIKSSRVLLKDVFIKGHELLDSTYNKQDKSTNQLKKWFHIHINKMAKDNKITIAKQKRTTLWNKVVKMMAKQLGVSSVGFKTSAYKGSKKTRRKSSRKTRRKSLSFGLDNTNQGYAFDQEFSQPNLESPYPFYVGVRDNWRPYSSLR